MNLHCDNFLDKKELFVLMFYDVKLTSLHGRKQRKPQKKIKMKTVKQT